MYPEPYVATPATQHHDIWFLHILLYQYWLWFVFIFLIVFFFLMFVATVRWCNPRVSPRLETRGVSRSKCADLITACVPVTWATSIIVNETTDALDFFDGFGTAEIVIGVRAYQWGWEYYYPRDIDFLAYQTTTPTLNAGRAGVSAGDGGSPETYLIARAEHKRLAVPRPTRAAHYFTFTHSTSAAPIADTNGFFLMRSAHKAPLYSETARTAGAPLAAFALPTRDALATSVSPVSALTPAAGCSAHTPSTILTDYDYREDLTRKLYGELEWDGFYDWSYEYRFEVPFTNTRVLGARASVGASGAAAAELSQAPTSFAATLSERDAHAAGPVTREIPTRYDTLYALTSFTPDSAETLAPLHEAPILDTPFVRKATREAVATAAAVQKVFRPRADEGKAHTLVSDLAAAPASLPATQSAPYYSLREFTKAAAPKHAYGASLSAPARVTEASALVAAFNVTRPAPLLYFNATSSDVLRGLWLDWYARWGSVSVKAADHSAYTIFGAPRLSGRSAIEENETLWADTETYLTRLARARRAASADLPGGTLVVPSLLRASSPITALTPATYESYEKTLLSFPALPANIGGIAANLFTAARLSYTTNHFVALAADPTTRPTLQRAASLPVLARRDGHLPLKKGINNLIRLHATGAIAFPTEVRINILASSKDVIHSWAIPSAGIKIDCIPGYSSHRTFLFLLTGIFWGQCMEICGRYHHWMPIIVFFMKRDLFFLWCSHFIFTDSRNLASVGLSDTGLTRHARVAAPLDTVRLM